MKEYFYFVLSFWNGCSVLVVLTAIASSSTARGLHQKNPAMAGRKVQFSVCSTIPGQAFALSWLLLQAVCFPDV